MDGEGLKRPWPPLIKMDDAVKAKVENSSTRSSRREEAQIERAESPKDNSPGQAKRNERQALACCFCAFDRSEKFLRCCRNLSLSIGDTHDDWCGRRIERADFQARTGQRLKALRDKSNAAPGFDCCNKAQRTIVLLGNGRRRKRHKQRSQPLVVFRTYSACA